MLKDGMSYKEIQDTTGWSRTTVAKYHPGRGWTHAEGVALGTFMKHHNAKMRKAHANYV